MTDKIAAAKQISELLNGIIRHGDFRWKYKIKVDPENEITYANRDRIVVAELDDLCMPHPLQAPPTQ